MDNLATYLIGGLILVVVVLNSIATFIVLRTYFVVKNRRLYQLLLIWLVPVLGALLIIFIDREEYFAQKKHRQVGNHSELSDTYAASIAKRK